MKLPRFQSPEGDSLFFYLYNDYVAIRHEWEFQSPEGDSLFFYNMGETAEILVALKPVSVPRRGFIVFLLEYPAC